MKLCFVSVNGPREPYLLDEPRTNEPRRWMNYVSLRHSVIYQATALQPGCGNRLSGYWSRGVALVKTYLADTRELTAVAGLSPIQLTQLDQDNVWFSSVECIV
jgi:hypothetical protein